jgi:hypothetical protein
MVVPKLYDITMTLYGARHGTVIERFQHGS